MIKLLHILLILLLYINTATANIWLIGELGLDAPSAGGETCTGAIQDGDNESFEKGTDQFCTTGWALDDTEGNVDTYNTNNPHCGSYSMNITNHTSTISNVTMTITDDTAFTFRFYILIADTVADYKTIATFALRDSDTNIENQFAIRHNATTDYRLYFDNTVGSYFAISAATLYYGELDWDGSGTSNGTTLKLYTVGDTPVNATNGSDSTTLASTEDDGISSVVFASDADVSSVFYDDIKYDSAGGSIGGRTCD